MRSLAVLALLLSLIASPIVAVELGDDGLHKPTWLRLTFKDMPEDLTSAKAEGKRLAIIFEQRGCIYCAKLHNEIFPDPRIDALIRKKYFFIQINLFGDKEVTDFDGTVLSEKKMSRRWGIVFTPTIMFMPDEIPKSGTAAQAAVMTVPGAFGIATTLDMLTWVAMKGYETKEDFQKYHARMNAERRRNGN